MALGTESGRIVLVEWMSDVGEGKEEWTVLDELNCDVAHHKTVTRLKFRPHSKNVSEFGERELLLASCGADGAVKIFLV